MTETIRVPIADPAHAAKVAEWYGALIVKAALTDVGDFNKLPGFALAMAVVERETATLHATAVAENLRAIARDGHDITTISTINLEFDRGRKPVLVITPMDLAELADGGPA